MTAAQKQTKKAEYEKYLNSSAWKNKRQIVLARDGHRCQRCPSTGPLDVHHKTYVRFGNEHLDDLLTLCRTCHDKHHERANEKVPRKRLPKKKSGVCLICSMHFNPKSYSQGGGWYCSSVCKKKSKAKKSMKKAKIIKVDPATLKKYGTIKAIEVASWLNLAP